MGRLIEEEKEIAVEREFSQSIVFNPLVAIQIAKLLQIQIEQIKANAAPEIKAALEAAEAVPLTQ